MAGPAPLLLRVLLRKRLMEALPPVMEPARMRLPMASPERLRRRWRRSGFCPRRFWIRRRRRSCAPLVNIIEADAAGNPHAQMCTTLLDKDGKVVDTNDPSRTVDQRYKPVDQGGEGAGLAKGDGVTVHFRMAAVTPNNADGEGTGVQEDTTYFMELPWQLVAAKQDKERQQARRPMSLDFFNSGDMTAKGGVYSRLGSDGPLAVAQVTLWASHRFRQRRRSRGYCRRVQYTTTVNQNVTSGSTVSRHLCSRRHRELQVNDDPTLALTVSTGPPSVRAPAAPRRIT